MDKLIVNEYGMKRGCEGQEKREEKGEEMREGKRNRRGKKRRRIRADVVY